jgi:hypothetical protein
MAIGVLEIALLRAEGIKGDEILGLGMANPYAIIKCGGQVQRSATAQNQGSRPTWNQTFTFNIEDGATELSVKLYNKNALYDGHIGDTRYGPGHTLTFSTPNSLYQLRIIFNCLHFSSIYCCVFLYCSQILSIFSLISMFISVHLIAFCGCSPFMFFMVSKCSTDQLLCHVFCPGSEHTKIPVSFLFP